MNCNNIFSHEALDFNQWHEGLLAVPKRLLTGRKDVSNKLCLKLITVNTSYSDWWTRLSSRQLLKTSLGRLSEQALSLKRCLLSTAETRKRKISHNELQKYLYDCILYYRAPPITK
jgi:hypothetical protein